MPARGSPSTRSHGQTEKPTQQHAERTELRHLHRRDVITTCEIISYMRPGPAREPYTRCTRGPRAVADAAGGATAHPRTRRAERRDELGPDWMGGGCHKWLYSNWLYEVWPCMLGLCALREPSRACTRPSRGAGVAGQGRGTNSAEAGWPQNGPRSLTLAIWRAVRHKPNGRYGCASPPFSGEPHERT